MLKHLKIILIIFLFPILLQAQYTTKYALVIGLNDYYIQPGVKHDGSLMGCVNDANAMRGLLINRFGFDPSNIQMLYNDKVTSKNVIGQMHAILEKCRPGDVFVFYYSGHGAWMSNPTNNADSVKKGMSQAMIMSDLYSPDLNCLLTDEMLKTVFNEFVDKKIIVTSIFDCCYSGNLAMPFNTDYWMPFVRPDSSKGMLMNTIPFIPEKIKPKGCEINIYGRLADETDSDNDGIPDCMDWEVNSPPLVQVDSLGVSVSEKVYADSIINMSSRFELGQSKNSEKAYNMKGAIKVWYPMKAKRPSERPNSNFISISAASDRQPGLEIRDENEIKHGAFTKALLSIYRENDANLPVSELLKKITRLMWDQMYGQTPTYHFAPGRLKGNLIGTSTGGLSNIIFATCLSAQRGIVTINKGMSDDIGRGNIFKVMGTKENISIEITKLTDSTSEAFDKSGMIKAGDKLQLIDRHTISNPLVKIFIPTMNTTTAGFEKFMAKIKRLTDSVHYADYFYNEGYYTDRLAIFSDGKNYKLWTVTSMLGTTPGFNDFFFLPIPSYISTGLNQLFSKDQNIELVQNSDEADYVLYFNYVKPRHKIPEGFVFYFHPPLEGEASKNIAILTRNHLEVPNLNFTPATLQQFSKKIHDMARETFRWKTKHWINTYPRR